MCLWTGERVGIYYRLRKGKREAEHCPKRPQRRTPHLALSLSLSLSLSIPHSKKAHPPPPPSIPPSIPPSNLNFRSRVVKVFDCPTNSHAIDSFSSTFPSTPPPRPACSSSRCVAQHTKKNEMKQPTAKKKKKSCKLQSARAAPRPSFFLLSCYRGNHTHTNTHSSTGPLLCACC